MGQQKSAAGCPVNIQREHLKDELDRAASTALAAIKQGRPKDLLGLFSNDGVALGVDGPLVHVAAIRKEVAARTGIYCIIFDTSCLREEVNASRRKADAPSVENNNDLLSFRDHLLKSELGVKTTLDANASSCRGTTSDDSPYFDMEWKWTARGWKIVAIPYP